MGSLLKAGVGFLPSNVLPFPSSAFSFLDAQFDLQNSKLLYICSSKTEPATCQSPTLANRWFVTPVSDTWTALPTFMHFTITPYPEKWFAYAAPFESKLLRQFPQGSPRWRLNLSVHSAFSERSWQRCQRLFILPVTSALYMCNTGQTTPPCQGQELQLTYPALNSYRGGLKSRGTHWPSPPCNRPQGKTGSTIAALKLQEGDPELKDNGSRGKPALFKHTQLFKLTT